MKTEDATTVTPEADISFVRDSLRAWWKDNHSDFPWRRRIPIWQAIAVEIMLQRTSADQVVPVFREFRRKYRTAKQFSAATYRELEELMKPLGLAWRDFRSNSPQR